jgi:hypothetical protein
MEDVGAWFVGGNKFKHDIDPNRIIGTEAPSGAIQHDEAKRFRDFLGCAVRFLDTVTRIEMTTE